MLLKLAKASSLALFVLAILATSILGLNEQEKKAVAFAEKAVRLSLFFPAFPGNFEGVPTVKDILDGVAARLHEKEADIDKPKLKEMFDAANFEALAIVGGQKQLLEEMIEKISDSIEAHIPLPPFNDLEAFKKHIEKDPTRIKPKTLSPVEYIRLRILIFYASYYKNVQNFLVKRIKKSDFKLAKGKEKQKEQKPGNDENEGNGKGKLRTDEPDPQESLIKLTNWLEKVMESLRKEIGKIVHMDNFGDKLADFLDWPKSSHGHKTIIKGQKLGEFELKLPDEMEGGEE